jgi:hypothetical protein
VFLCLLFVFVNLQDLKVINKINSYSNSHNFFCPVHVTLSVSPSGKSVSGKSSSKRKADEIWSDGLVPLSRSPLDPYLSDTLPPSVTITDACLPVLTLLRVLNAVNRNWGKNA